MKILAIESTCDETAVAVVEKLESGKVRVLGQSVASSLAEHIQTGGIVPEIAARKQLQFIIPVLEDACKKAQEKSFSTPLSLKNYLVQEIDALAVSVGPGLIGSLLVGVETAKTLALILNKPLIPVNHVLAHVYASFIENVDLSDQLIPEFPTLSLIISGGHTQFVLFKSHQDYQVIGTTRDDAVGECFDKCARILGLPYPGGPEISKLALQAEKNNLIDGKISPLPSPLLSEDSLDMSFSGLKAAFVREVNKAKQTNTFDVNKTIELAYFLETSISSLLSKKLLKAFESVDFKSVILAGGVAANTRIRNTIASSCDQIGVKLHLPEIKYCTDNAAMIGAYSLYNPIEKNILEIKAYPSLSLWHLKE